MIFNVFTSDCVDPKMSLCGSRDQAIETCRGSPVPDSVLPSYPIHTDRAPNKGRDSVVLKIIFCKHCTTWLALLTCPSCRLESRQVRVEGDWSAAVSLNLDPVDDVQGSEVRCAWCGWSGFVDDEQRSRRSTGAVYTFDVDRGEG